MERIGAIPNTSATRLAVPAEPKDREIYKLCVELRGKRITGFPQFVALLDRYLESGEGLDRGEFEKLLNLGPTGGVTKQFWLAFTGGKKVIKSRTEFLDALNHCRESLEVTGDSLIMMARTKHIIVVSREEAGKLLKNMQLPPLDQIKYPRFRRIYEAARSITKDTGSIQDGEQLKDKTYELIAFALFSEFVRVAWKDLGYEQIENLNFTDPWVVGRFRPMFERFVVENADPTEKEVDDLVSFSKKVEKFREWTRLVGISFEIKMSNFEVNSKDENGRYILDRILDSYQSLGAEGVKRALGLKEGS